MSLRKKAKQAAAQSKPLNQAEIFRLQKLEQMKTEAQGRGLSPEQVSRKLAAEETVYQIKGDQKGKSVPDGFEKISDMPIEQGTVLKNPVTGKLDGYIDNSSGDLRTMHGGLHPATQKWMDTNRSKYGNQW